MALVVHWPAQAVETKQTVTLTVDASEVHEQRIDARLEIPASPGPLTLLYPKWVPGTHEPSGPIGRLGGLKLSAGGKPVAWQRDPLDMFAFHCEVPSGASSLLTLIGSTTNGRTRRTMCRIICVRTPSHLVLKWA